MSFPAVLDACVLFLFSLRDTLLRLAERELYDILWSGRILQEMAHNVVDKNFMTASAAERLVTIMGQAFEAAEVSSSAIQQLEPVMTNHPKDRHVLAAAVVAHAEVVVTANLSDFPDDACLPLGVVAVHPDDFLLSLHAKRRTTVLEVLQQQAADLINPPMTLDDVLDALGKQVPRFVMAVRQSMAGSRELQLQQPASTPTRFVGRPAP